MNKDITRRDALKAALRAGGYAAPALVAAKVATSVAAATPVLLADIAVPDAHVVGPDTVHNGGTITFMSTVTNLGPSTAVNVRATDYPDSHVPSSYLYVSSSVTLGTYTPPTGPYSFFSQGSWAIGTLAPGQSATLTVTFQQSGQTVAMQAGYYDIVAVSDTPDPNPRGNNGRQVTFLSTL